MIRSPAFWPVQALTPNELMPKWCRIGRQGQRPSSTSSISSRRATAYSVMRPPSSDGGFGAGREAQLRHLLELTHVARQLEERQQPRSLARAEAVAQLLEVAREKAGRIAVALARLVREVLRLGAGGQHRVDQRLLQVREPLGDRLGARPDREDHRQAGALEPQSPEVVVRRRVLERALERRVADQEPPV